jgi:hypothetical protein
MICAELAKSSFIFVLSVPEVLSVLFAGNPAAGTMSGDRCITRFRQVGTRDDEDREPGGMRKMIPISIAISIK